MHEFSLAEDLLKLARVEASKAGIVRLDRIVVRIGSVSGVNIDSLEFAYGFLREEEDITKDAKLEIERVQGRGRCRSCGSEVDLERIFLLCPHCESATIEIIEGREFILVSLEGEDSSDEKDETKAVMEDKNG